MSERYGSHLEKLDPIVGGFCDMVKEKFTLLKLGTIASTSLVPHVETLHLEPTLTFPRLDHILKPGNHTIVERPLVGHEMAAIETSWFDGAVVHINNPYADSEEESLITYHVRNGRLMKHFIGDTIVDPFGDFEAGFGQISEDTMELMSLHPSDSSLFVSQGEYYQLRMYVLTADVLSYSTPNN